MGLASCHGRAWAPTEPPSRWAPLIVPRSRRSRQVHVVAFDVDLSVVVGVGGEEPRVGLVRVGVAVGPWVAVAAGAAVPWRDVGVAADLFASAPPDEVPQHVYLVVAACEFFGAELG